MAFRVRQGFLSDGAARDADFSDAQDVIDFGIYPNCNFDEDFDPEMCILPIGHLRPFGQFCSSVSAPLGYAEIEMYFTGSNRVQECIDFLSVHWENIVPADMWHQWGYIAISGSNVIYDPTAAMDGYKLSYTLEEIADKCKSNCADHSCYIYFQFRN